jgi:hypothetical protein
MRLLERIAELQDNPSIFQYARVMPKARISDALAFRNRNYGIALAELAQDLIKHIDTYIQASTLGTKQERAFTFTFH